MKTRFLLSILLYVIASGKVSGSVGPSFISPIFPTRHYWFNPGALCHDSSSVVSVYSRYIPGARVQNIPIINAFLEGWMSAEIRLPGKAGSLGIQTGFTDIIGTVWDTKKASLSYAYSFRVSGGKLGIGLQADLMHFRVDWAPDWGWPSNPTINGEDLRPDLSAGIYYQVGNFTTGISGYNLLPSDVRLHEGDGNVIINSDRGMNCMLGYQRRLNEKWKVYAATLLNASFRGNGSIGISRQFNFTGTYRDKYNVGISLPHRGDAIINLNTGIRIGRMDWFTILPVPEGFFFPKEFQLGINYPIGANPK